MLYTFFFQYSYVVLYIISVHHVFDLYITSHRLYIFSFSFTLSFYIHTVFINNIFFPFKHFFILPSFVAPFTHIPFQFSYLFVHTLDKSIATWRKIQKSAMCWVRLNQRYGQIYIIYWMAILCP